MFRTVVIVALLCGVAAPAAAEPEVLVGYGGFGTGFGGLYGDLGREFDSNVLRSTLHGGLRVDNVDVSWHFTAGFLGSDEVALHGSELVSLAFGPDVRYLFGSPHDVAQLYVRGGFARVWWKGSDKVQRTCEQTGACTAGFYAEAPDYAGFAARAGVGIQITPPMRRTNFYMHMSLDVGYQLINMKLISDRETGHMLTASFRIAYGGGRKGHSR